MRECGLVAAPRLHALPSRLIAFWKGSAVEREPLRRRGSKIDWWLDRHRTLDSVETEPFPKAILIFGR